MSDWKIFLEHFWSFCFQICDAIFIVEELSLLKNVYKCGQKMILKKVWSSLSSKFILFKKLNDSPWNFLGYGGGCINSTSLSFLFFWKVLYRLEDSWPNGSLVPTHFPVWLNRGCWLWNEFDITENDLPKGWEDSFELNYSSMNINIIINQVQRNKWRVMLIILVSVQISKKKIT
jgi:hypothetical protein